MASDSGRRGLRELQCELAQGKESSQALVEACLARATDPRGEGARVFLKLWSEEALSASRASDFRLKLQAQSSPLTGIPVSVKDLFDVAGEVTLAGSRVRVGSLPATRDAAVVQRLKAAGAVLIGRTNMSEFAFSGLGLNPHYGTPGNPWNRACIPGGSSSGAAVSVADGMAIAAIGSDTGGSIRIPAALCGLTGFKPTSSRIPLDGAFPLSTTLDSVGVIGHRVEDCMLIDALLAGQAARKLEAPSPARLRFGVPRTLVLDDLDRSAGRAFENALSVLSRAGAKIVEFDMPLLGDIAEANAQGGFSAMEAFAQHEPLLASRGHEYDPRARARFEQGARQTAADYIRLCWRRTQLIRSAIEVMSSYDALLAPTCPFMAPRIQELERDDDLFRKLNPLVSRNTALVNFLDGCAISLPIQPPGEAPVGLMAMGASGTDARLFEVAGAIESLLTFA